MSRRYHKKGTQLTINHTLRIPDDKPDIEFLLRTTSTPIIEKAIAVDKKIIFSGYILICIEYVASIPDGTQPIHFVSFEHPFESMMSHRFVRAGMNAQMKGSVEISEFRIDSPRDVNIAIDFKACSVRIARACKPLPPHLCKPFTNLCKPDSLKELMPGYTT